MNKKTCSKCKIEQNISEFYKDKKSLNGTYPVCKQCKRFYQREKNKERKNRDSEYSTKLCEICGNSFRARKYKIKVGLPHTCSTKCRSIFVKQSDKKRSVCGGWKRLSKEFIISTYGYKMIYKPEHINSNSAGYIFEHRLVMSEHLNRELNKKEVVHHINGNILDNRIENLMLFNNNGEHTKYHKQIKI